MKTISMFLLTLLLTIGTIVCVIMIKAEPTISDTELLMMVQVAEDNRKNDISTAVNTTIGTTQNESELTITENTTNKIDNFNNKETTKSENITTEIIVCQHKSTSTSTTNATCTSNGKRVTINWQQMVMRVHPPV